MSAASEPAQRDRVASLRASLAEVKALSDTGQWPAARRKLAPLVDAARATGHGGLLAEVLERRAWLEERSGEMRAAAATYEQALWLAIAAHRDEVALACAAQLVAIFGYHFNDGAAGERWDRLGQALHGRLGSGHERVAAWLIHNHGLLRLRKGDLQAALADARAALALKQQVLPAQHPDIAGSWTSIGDMLGQVGDHAGALAAQDKALDIFRQAYGADSPLLGHPLSNRGEVLVALGRYREAEHDLRLSIERWSAHVGPDHPWVAYALTALGKGLVADQRAAEAIAPLDKAVRIRAAEPDGELVAESQFALARARWAVGRDRAAARALAVTARDGYRKLPARAKQTAEIDAWLAGR